MVVPALVLASFVFLSTGSPVLAKCDPTIEPDKSDVANARAAVAANCSCNGLSHGDYVRCARTQADLALNNPSCVRAVKRCAGKSTCGKPGYVTCCRTNSRGTTKCKIKPDSVHCKAPKNGTACVAAHTSCCDACTATGCAPTTTTTTLPVTFAADVQPIFTSRCAVAFCHAPPAPAQGLDLSPGSSYANIVNVPSSECPSSDLIEPSSPGTSYLITKVQGAGPCFTGSQMPLSGGPLTPAQVQTLVDWVAQGAPNN